MRLQGGIPTNTNEYYGYWDSQYFTGCVGMPYAWTGITKDQYGPGLSVPAYGNSSAYDDYCYLGFEVSSPFLQNTPPSGWTSTNYQYGYFAYYFYRYALGLDNNGAHATIADSLDYAARMTFGNDIRHNNDPYTFGNSILNNGYWFYTSLDGMEGWWYWRMRTFGNAEYLYLPY